MPLDAPVTIATLLDSLLIFAILHPERIVGNSAGIQVPHEAAAPILSTIPLVLIS
jgi:hypothetical protein